MRSRSTTPKLGPSMPAATMLVRRQMQGNRSGGTAPELALRRALWAAGLRGYRVNWKKVQGSPDVAFVHLRVAVFVMGCFWHRCPRCQPSTPRTNAAWWHRKFTRNRNRDARTRRALRRAGWEVVDLWECQIKRVLSGCIERVGRAIDHRAQMPLSKKAVIAAASQKSS
jgi:DNA mismatch endonuclease (patch repair protein)